MSFNICLATVLPSWAADCEEVVRAFNPYLVIDPDAGDFLNIECADNQIKISSSFAKEYSEIFSIDAADDLSCKRIYKRNAKNAIYKYLSGFLGVALPYGSSTGVRPTALVRGVPKGEDVVAYLQDNYFIEEKRARLLAKTVRNQEKYISYNPQEIDLYINIPFCPSRCSYCSFISIEAGKVANRLEDYVNAVIFEAEEALKYIKDAGKRIRSIYVGGGTPTSLPPSLLGRLLGVLSGLSAEYNVEAGRPDTINGEILSVLAQCGVTRISINPQSLNDKTLQRIGRSHTVADFYRAWESASAYNFIKNTDIILGLPDEDGGDIVATVTGIFKLAPENITVHTLSLKRGGRLVRNASKSDFLPLKKHADSVLDMFDIADWLPYYIYRQKNMIDGLENTGYMRAGAPCLYNIDIMEETHSVIGLGAGAMTKSVNNDIITRHNSPKDINYYLGRLEENLAKKLTLLKGQVR